MSQHATEAHGVLHTQHRDHHHHEDLEIESQLIEQIHAKGNSHGKGLVQVHVTNVTPTNRRVSQTNLSIEIGTVQVNLATIVMNDLASL